MDHDSTRTLDRRDVLGSDDGGGAGAEAPPAAFVLMPESSIDRYCQTRGVGAGLSNTLSSTYP
jgi:hypothetical protein